MFLNKSLLSSSLIIVFIVVFSLALITAILSLPPHGNNRHLALFPIATPTIGILPTTNSNTPFIAFTDRFGSVLPIGYHALSTNGGMLTFIGRLDKTYLATNTVNADIIINNTNKKITASLFLDKQSSTQLFFLTLQNTPNVAPLLGNIQKKVLTPQTIISTLTPYIGKPIIFIMQVKSVNGGKTNTAWQACNQQYLTFILNSTTTIPSCTPVIYQGSAYENF